MFTIITYGNIFFLSFIIIESNSLLSIKYSFSVLLMIIILIIIKGVTSLIDYSPNRTFQGQ